MLRRSMLAAVALMGLSQAALAECVIKEKVEFNPANNDSLTIKVVMEKQNRFCDFSYDHLEKLTIDRWEIMTKPLNGSLAFIPKKKFRYERAKGWVGQENIVFKVCTQLASGEGCSTLTYDIKAEYGTYGCRLAGSHRMTGPLLLTDLGSVQQKPCCLPNSRAKARLLQFSCDARSALAGLHGTLPCCNRPIRARCSTVCDVDSWVKPMTVSSTRNVMIRIRRGPAFRNIRVCAHIPAASSRISGNGRHRG